MDIKFLYRAEVSHARDAKATLRIENDALCDRLRALCASLSILERECDLFHITRRHGADWFGRSFISVLFGLEEEFMSYMKERNIMCQDDGAFVLCSDGYSIGTDSSVHFKSGDELIKWCIKKAAETKADAECVKRS